MEYKLSESADLQTSILGLDFRTDVKPSNPKNYDLEELKEHILNSPRTFKIEVWKTFIKIRQFLKENEI